MSKAILISVHPEYVDKILLGEKVYEYRRVMPAQAVSYLVMYCTAPVKKIVAVVEVVDRLGGTPSSIWTKTAHGAGITRKFYITYFAGRNNANAFVLGNVYKLTEPLELTRLSARKVPPQSFSYLSECDIELLLKKSFSSPILQKNAI